MAEQGEAQQEPQQQQLQVTGCIVAYTEAFADGDVLRHIDAWATANGWGETTKGRVALTYLKGRGWTVSDVSSA